MNKGQIFITIFIFILLLLLNNKKLKETFTSHDTTANSVPEIDNSLFEEYERSKAIREENERRLGAKNNPELKDKYLKTYTGEGTYKRVPLPNKSLLLEEDMDEGILKNYRINPDMNTYSQEIFYEDMNKIVNTILFAGSFDLVYGEILDLKGNLKKDKIHKLICNNLVFVINNSFKMYKLNHKNNKFDKRQYKLLDYKILNDSEIKDLSIDNRNLIFNIKVFKNDKDFHYTLQVSCNYNFITKKVTYLNIDIIGITDQEKIKFANASDLIDENCRVDKKYNGEVKTCFRDELNNNKSLQEFEKEFQELDVKEFMDKKKKEELKHNDYIKYKCFLKKGFNDSTCKAYDSIKGTIGVYDKPCNVNDDCPFYKKNKNYENARGGCINGYCEMPVNIERVGYKNYRMANKPFCYGCNRSNCLGEECFDCCEEQKNDPNLNSPDYMFSNDMYDRRNLNL